jgi:LmbE family N-acetylglucosaminyl deacetylase
VSSPAAPVIDLRRAGPDDREWSRRIAGLRPFAWPDAGRLVVVSPHPDDETLGAGGLIAAAADRGLAVLVVAVTDGEASAPVDDLAAVRRRELVAAMGRLDPSGEIDLVHLGLPDGDVTSHVSRLVSILGAELRETDLVACPLLDDGHPDHEATSRAAIVAAAGAGAAVRTFPVWAWHWHEPMTSPINSATRLPLTADVRARKRAAIACYESQLRGDEPVVPAHVLVRLDRATEVFVTPREFR